METTQAALVPLRRLLTALRGVSRLVARESDPQALVTHAAELLVEALEAENACVIDGWGTATPLLGVDGDPARAASLRERFEAGDLPECLVSAIEGHEAVDRMLTDERCDDCRAARCRDAGVRAIAVSLGGPERTTGGLVVHCRRPDHPAEAIEILRELGETLSIGLRRIDTERELQSERKLGEAKLQLLTTALQAAANGVAITDRAGSIEWVNDAFTRLAGWRLDEVIGQHTRILRSDEHDAGFYRDLWGTISSGRVWTGELRNRRKDGSLYQEGMTIAPVRDARGEISHFISVKQDITQRKLAEQAVQDSEERFRTALERLPIPIALTDDNGGSVYFNRTLVEEFGYTLEDAPNVATWWRLAIPDAEERADFLARRRAVLRRFLAEHGTDFGYACRITCKDGSVRDVELTGRKVGDLWVSAFLDLTEHRHARAALVEAEEWSRLAVDAAGLGTWRHDVATGYVVFGGRGMEHFGYDRPVVTIAELLDRVHPEDRPVVDAATRKGLDPNGDCTAHSEYRAVHPSGEIRWLVTRVIARFEGEGAARHPVFAIATSQDVTREKMLALERERSDQALRVSEERFRQLVDNMDEIVFSVDLSGRTSYVNRAIERFGYRPEEVIGRGWCELVHPEDRGEVVRRTLDAFEENSGPREYRMRDASGRWRAVRTTTRPMLSFGERVGVTGVMTDLSEQREIEEQLRVAQKMEAVGRLAGGVAHDFNNLLTVILSYSEMATTTLHAEDPLHADLVEVVGAARRAQALTRQLLAFSRRQVLKPEPVDLVELVSGLAKMLKRLIGEQVTLEVRCPTPVSLTRVDRGQIEQVVMNLVVNARDAMPGGGHIEIALADRTFDGVVAAERSLEPGQYVELAVRDTGTGMDEATMARIFEPFFTTKGVGQGTGLGLSMVYGILKQSGGGVHVESRPGEGATFHVYLPRLQGEAEAAKRHDSGPPRARSTETVLVIEDDAPLRAVARRVLSAAGFRVYLAAGGDDAVRVARDHGPEIDLVFSDVVMPGRNGPEVVAALRPLCPKARVLYTSGYVDDAVANLVPGADLLQKPYDWRTLAATVRAVLDRPPSDEPSEAEAP